MLAPIEAGNGGRYQVAWLKAIGSGPQKRFVAVGTGETIDLPQQPGANLLPEGISRDAGAGGQPPGPDGRATGVVSTCRLTFDLGDLSPTTAVLQFQYIACNRLVAVRLNGKEIPARREVGAGPAPRSEGGQFNVRGGLGHDVFVRGVNTLELDVDQDATWSASNPATPVVDPDGGERYPKKCRQGACQRKKCRHHACAPRKIMRFNAFQRKTSGEAALAVRGW